jgi:phenylalanyl-tRNA synthetase alpha chain
MKMIEQTKAEIIVVENFTTTNKEELEQFRLKYLGKKGLLNDFFAAFKAVPNEDKKEFGQVVNLLKNATEEKVKSLQESFDNQASMIQIFGDLTRPGEPFDVGSRHPISIVKNQVIDIFSSIGFNVSEGPEIEDDWHNFTALNLPEHHPARDMQDTFFIQTNPDILLRTHTSSVQVRYMENNKPPIRTISPGRVFRNEAISSRSHCIFHQIEGLYIDKNVSFADLKQTLLYFTKEMFGKSKIMGCGMVDPNVLTSCGINPSEYTGYAFGMGLERMAMLMYQVSDIRLFFENDVRFLEQFKSTI